MNDSISRATIENIVRHRNRAINLCSEAYEIATAADARIKEARVTSWNIVAAGFRICQNSFTPSVGLT